jgi:CBS domain-containing protein
MRVKHLMSSNPLSCGPMQSASDAARLMWEHDIGSIPIVDPEGIPVGMITDRDLCMAAYTRGKPLSEIIVGDVMSTEVYTCGVEDSLSSASRIMRAWQVRRLPVTDDEGRLVGVLSINDIVLARASKPVEKVKKRVLGNVAETLAAVSRHREADGTN